MSDVNGLWIGPRLSPLERACVQSFLAKGHRFNLFAYDTVANVPDACTVLDAATLVPRSHVFAHSSGPGEGSLAGFSDLFRYKLLYEHGGWLWIVIVGSVFPLLALVRFLSASQNAAHCWSPAISMLRTRARADSRAATH